MVGHGRPPPLVCNKQRTPAPLIAP